MRVRRMWTAVGTGVLAAAALLLVVGQGAGAAGTKPAASRQTGEMTHTVHLPLTMRTYVPGYVSPFGVVMYGNVDEGAGLAEMEAAGSSWVTTFLNWSSIEGTEDTYDWSSFDRKAQNAQASGMDVFVLFSGNPTWAAALPGGPVTDTQDLVEFAADMAERYDCDGVDDAPKSPCVHTWSFYAEPDNGDPWRAERGKGCWGDDTDPRCGNGADYAEMLSQVAPAIHAANPKAQVLIGGVAYDYFEPGGPFVRSFLTDTLSALETYTGGVEAFIDAVAFHYYPISQARWPTILEKTAEIQGIMERNGAGDLPLMCPEMGYWSSPKHGSSEDGQAARLVQMFVRSLSMDVQPLSWYKVFDNAVPESKEDHAAGETTGLLRVDGTKKPSYYAYQRMVDELNQARYLRTLDQEDVEGYVFRMPDGREKTVAWATVSEGVEMVFPHTCLRMVEVKGEPFMPITDGLEGFDRDGTMNGEIAIAMAQDWPRFVVPCP